MGTQPRWRATARTPQSPATAATHGRRRSSWWWPATLRLHGQHSATSANLWRCAKHGRSTTEHATATGRWRRTAWSAAVRQFEPLHGSQHESELPRQLTLRPQPWPRPRHQHARPVDEQLGLQSGVAAALARHERPLRYVRVPCFSAHEIWTLEGTQCEIVDFLFIIFLIYTYIYQRQGRERSHLSISVARDRIFNCRFSLSERDHMRRLYKLTAIQNPEFACSLGSYVFSGCENRAHLHSRFSSS